jgi:hypothetical protein
MENISSIPVSVKNIKIILDIKTISEFSNDPESIPALLFKEIFYDIKKKIRYFILSNKKQVMVFKILDSVTPILSENLIFNCPLENENYFAFCIFLNRIFIINSLTLVYIIDFDKKQIFSIELEEESIIELCENHSYVYLDTKIIFTGGINKNGIVNKTMTSFDISLYKFNEEKIRDNNFIPRHKHGSVVIGDIIYVVGGFTSSVENKENICKKIQAIKKDNLMNTWLEVKVEGEQPELLINPQITINSENMVCYSDYIYPKIFILKHTSSTGVMINLSNINLSKEISAGSIFIFKNFSNKNEISCNESSIVYINNKHELETLDFVFNL